MFHAHCKWEIWHCVDENHVCVIIISLIALMNCRRSWTGLVYVTHNCGVAPNVPMRIRFLHSMNASICDLKSSLAIRAGRLTIRILLEWSDAHYFICWEIAIFINKPFIHVHHTFQTFKNGLGTKESYFVVGTYQDAINRSIRFNNICFSSDVFNAKFFHFHANPFQILKHRKYEMCHQDNMVCKRFWWSLYRWNAPVQIPKSDVEIKYCWPTSCGASLLILSNLVHWYCQLSGDWSLGSTLLLSNVLACILSMKQFHLYLIISDDDFASILEPISKSS